jgi:hypothetical protein
MRQDATGSDKPKARNAAVNWAALVTPPLSSARGATASASAALFGKRSKGHASSRDALPGGYAGVAHGSRQAA